MTRSPPMALASSPKAPRAVFRLYQPQVRDFALSPSAALVGIQDAASRFNLNVPQLKSIASLCDIMQKHMTPVGRNRDEIAGLLRKIYARCVEWEKATLVQSVALVPGEMNLFEQLCITKCASYDDKSRYSPTPEDKTAERARVASAIQEIVSTEPHRSEAMKLKDKAAEMLVSQIQTTLDDDINNPSSTLNPRLREECIKALRKVCAQAGVLPMRAIIVDEVILKDHPTAEGGFSSVYEATWNGKAVAVKRPRRFASQSGKSSNSTQVNEQTLLEISLSLQLSHKYLLPLLGVIVEDGPSYSLVYDWMTNGTVRQYLSRHPTADRSQIVFQIAQGLKFLHDFVPVVAHGDLKSENVLIDQDGWPRIADFGQSCLNYSIDRTKTSNNYAGTERYLAPEQLLPQRSNSADHNDEMLRATLEGDIWSFAMLIYEIFTGTVIFSGQPPQAVLLELVHKKSLPPRPPRDVEKRGLNDEIWKIMNECWKYEPAGRPKIDYVVRNLDRAINYVPRTATEGTENEFIPAALVKQLINDDGANWKELNVKLVPNRGNIVRDNVEMTVISITGDASAVAETRHRISEAIQKMEYQVERREVRVPKEFHGLVHGKKRTNINKLEQKFGIRIRVPGRASRSEKFVIEGPGKAVSLAEEELHKSIAYAKRSIVSVSSRAAEIISNRAHIFRLFLRDIVIDVPAGKIKIYGDHEGMETARRKIKDIQKEADSEVFEEVSVHPYIWNMLNAGEKAWTDIVERCCSSEHVESMGKYGLREKGLHHTLKIQGPPEQVVSLREELEHMTGIGNECVTGKRVFARHHKSMLQPQKQFIKHVRERCGAMVYFPGSGGYEYAGVPNNMDRYDDENPKDIVKLVGSFEACAKARGYFQDLLQKEAQNVEFIFPGALQDLTLKILEPRFRLLGISTESDSPQSAAQSILPLISDDHEGITRRRPSSDRGPDWVIHSRKSEEEIWNMPQCIWKLKADSAEASRKGGGYLTKAVLEAIERARRIGIVRVQDSRQLGNLKRVSTELETQEEDICIFETVGGPNTAILVAGPSSEQVETTIRKLITRLGLSNT